MGSTAEVERACLACMVSSPRAASKVAGMLVAQDFVSHEHKVVFETMRCMVDEGQRIDEITLSAELAKDGHEDLLAYAGDLYAAATSIVVEHAEEYANVIREESVRRHLGRGVDDAMGAKGDVEQVVEQLENAVFTARSRLQGESDSRTHDSASILRPLEAILRGSESRGGLPYPYPYLRENLGLMEAGTYSILSGYSGDGKTTAAFQWVEEMCEAGGRVLVEEMEMTAKGVAKLLALQGAGLTGRQIKGLDPIGEEDRERYAERERQVKSWDLHINTGPTSPGQIRAVQMRERYDAIFVDHMQKFDQADDYANITRYSGQLHRIARDLDCSVIALSQLRTPQDGSRPMPTPQMLRGTRAMEEDADNVFFVWRKRAPGGSRDSEGRFIIGKSREGSADQMFRIDFDPTTVRFVETTSATGPSVAQRRRDGNQDDEVT